MKIRRRNILMNRYYTFVFYFLVTICANNIFSMETGKQLIKLEEQRSALQGMHKQKTHLKAVDYSKFPLLYSWNLLEDWHYYYKDRSLSHKGEREKKHKEQSIEVLIARYSCVYHVVKKCPKDVRNIIADFISCDNTFIIHYLMKCSSNRSMHDLEKIKYFFSFELSFAQSFLLLLLNEAGQKKQKIKLPNFLNKDILVASMEKKLKERDLSSSFLGDALNQLIED